ncbi:MAG TPA: aromatic ring-hydroxylating dioxygenase subunit alpha [Abditibacteriaceae bacterium]|nr:aromatic ring-hydroxylating dioxygenase subunit alpha [Abditibacteriaceae bacterium]
MENAPITNGEVKCTLPGEYYHSAEVHARELERIFYNSWLCAGRTESLPNVGDFFVRGVGPESIIVTRAQSGDLRAFYNVCRHRGARLCAHQQGHFRGNVMTCAYHRWSYALDGELVATPNMPDGDLDKAEYSLYPVGLRTYEGFIYINLAGDDAPLSEPLGGFEEQAAPYHLGKLHVARTVNYDVNANWKIVVENFMECYHCPGVHPELCQVVPDFRKALVHQGKSGGARLVEGATTLTASGTSNRPPIGDLTPEDIGIYRSKVRYPNLFLSFHCDYVLTHTLWPRGAGSTHVICDWLFEPSTIARADFDASDGVDMWDLVNRQDWEMCELTQQGVQSRAYQHGVYGARESLLHHFNEYVRERLS